MDNSPNKAQQAFIDALLLLMKEKSYNQISVSELSEIAQYDRRTCLGSTSGLTAWIFNNYGSEQTL